MASNRMKSPGQIRMEMLINNLGYILLHLIILIVKITGFILAVVAQMLHLPTIHAILWGWFYPTALSKKIRQAYKFISDNLTLQGALLVICPLLVSPPC
jgi:hypothetical protein